MNKRRKMKLIKTNDNENYFIIAEDDEVQRAVPYYTECFEFESLEDLEDVLSGKKEFDNWEELSQSYYNDGDVLFEDDLEKFQDSADVLIKDENGILKLNDCFWDWEDFYVYWDGNNNRSVGCDIEIDDFEYEIVEFETDEEGSGNSSNYNILKSNGQYYVEELSNIEGEGNSVFEADVEDGEIWFSSDSSVGLNFVLKESKKSFKEFINES